MKKTTLNNPIMWADVPDVDPIRVGNTYYMVSTSMHSMPGCPIMKSEDLVNWEIVSYVFDTLEDNDAHNLINGKSIYGNGSWAASLRYHNETFYVCFSCNDMQQFYIYQTKDIETGKWDRSVIKGLRHDPALLFDEDRVFVIYGNGDIHIEELTEDATAIKPGGINQLLFSTEKENIGLRCEGCHAYKINEQYYLLYIEWPREGRRREICYRSNKLLGNYERKIIFDADMGYHNNGIAQGGIFETQEHKWYAMLFQDHGAVGRIPCVLPVNWIDEWPMVGIDGKAPKEFEVALPPSNSCKSLVISDEFDYNGKELDLNWQWNHNPHNDFWSLTKRPGYLRLETVTIADSILHAPNTLTQRTEGPFCTGITVMDISHMKPGDSAGLVAFQSNFGTVGIKSDKNGVKYITMCMNDGNGGESIVEKNLFNGELVHLKIEFNFDDSIDIAKFYYSANGNDWSSIGNSLKMKYTLDHFMGYRIGLFNYAAKETGGYVDFDYFHYSRG
jgi:beta-xylosidase